MRKKNRLFQVGREKASPRSAVKSHTQTFAGLEQIVRGLMVRILRLRGGHSERNAVYSKKPAAPLRMLPSTDQKFAVAAQQTRRVKMSRRVAAAAWLSMVGHNGSHAQIVTHLIVLCLGDFSARVSLVQDVQRRLVRRDRSR